MYINVFHQIWEVSIHGFLIYYFFPFHFLLFFWAFRRFCSFFFLLSLPTLQNRPFHLAFSSSLILSSVCSNLLGPSNEFAFQLLHIFIFFIIYQFRSVAQSCPTLRDPMDCSTWGFPVHHQLPGLPKLMSIESVMPSNHLVHLCPLLLLPSIFPSIRVFFNESVLCIRWSKYWSFSISPSNEWSRLISFRIDWLDLLAFQWDS